VAAYAGALGLIGYLLWGRHDSSGTGSIWLLAGVAYVGTLVVLGIVWALLLNVCIARVACCALCWYTTINDLPHSCYCGMGMIGVRPWQQ
jgi:hypothetical protein